MLSRRYKSVLVGTTSALTLAIAMPSFAAEPQQAAAVEEIVVTGTRIQTNGFTAPVPTTVLSRESIENAALPNIADVVNQMPQLAGSGTPSTGNATAPGGLTGQNVLSLRSIGVDAGKATLVLMDGVRVVPTGPNGTTDINNIPSQLVQRVDIVTGGASAIYGSDAVSGVVNFILDKKFVGFKGNVEGGVSTYGDDAERSGNLTYGTGLFGDRGHFLLSAGASKSDGAAIGTDRKWFRNIHLIPNTAGNPTGANNGIPAQLTVANTFYSSAPNGSVAAGQFAGTAFGPGGTPYSYPYVLSPLGKSGFVVGPADGCVTTFTCDGTNLSIAGQLANATLFSRLSYDITDDITSFVQVNYGYSRTKTTQLAEQLGAFAPITIRFGNPFIPASLAARMTPTGPNSSFNVASRLADIGPVGQDNTRATTQITVGLDGNIFDSWKWKIYYQRGMSKITQSLNNVYNSANMNAATQAIVGPNGTPICNPAFLVSSAGTADPGCQPLNILGSGVASAAAIDYVFGSTREDERYVQQVSEATLSGNLFDLWAGPLAVVVGAGYRRESITTPFIDSTSAGALAFAFSKGTVGNNGWLVGNWPAFNAAYNVYEGFGEAVLPLARGAKWAKSMDLDAAVRVTDYSSSGTVATWKVGLNYVPADEFLFRGSVSRDIRAPTLAEYYGGSPTTVAPTLDPLNGNASTFVPTTPGVNPALTPEYARSYGVGGVYSPAWLDGLTASVDYWQINLSAAIAALSAQNAVNACANGTNPSYCQFFTRGSGTLGNGTVVPNAILSAIAPNININSAKARGIDFEVSYRKNLEDWFAGWDATLTVRALGTYNIENSRVESNVYHDYAGQNGGNVPHFRSNVQASYLDGPWNWSATWRYISKGVLQTSFYDVSKTGIVTTTPLSVDNNHIPSVSYFDLGVSYKFQVASSDVELFTRVTNAFNKSPPVIATTSAFSQQYNPFLYDAIGRFFRVGLRFKM